VREEVGKGARRRCPPPPSPLQTQTLSLSLSLSHLRFSFQVERGVRGALGVRAREFQGALVGGLCGWREREREEPSSQK